MPECLPSKLLHRAGNIKLQKLFHPNFSATTQAVKGHMHFYLLSVLRMMQVVKCNQVVFLATYLCLGHSLSVSLSCLAPQIKSSDQHRSKAESVSCCGTRVLGAEHELCYRK